MKIGTDIEPVPVTGLAANFSPIPRIAPPPLGRDMLGILKVACSACAVHGLLCKPLSSMSDPPNHVLLRRARLDERRDLVAYRLPLAALEGLLWHARVGINRHSQRYCCASTIRATTYMKAVNGHRRTLLSGCKTSTGARCCGSFEFGCLAGSEPAG